MFPVFEILRRIFLTAMLMAFYPGSMAQVVVGLTASMISFAVYNHYEPYIEDDDDAVSAVAQTQLTLVYFASFVVYSSERLEKKEGVFSSDAFGSFLILLFLTSFFVAVWTVLLELWGYSTVVDRIDATRKSLSQTLRTSLRSLMSTQDSSNSIDVDESGSTNPSPRESADSDRSSMPFNHSGVSDEKDGEVGERKSEEIECADTSPCDEGSALERSSSRLDYHLYVSKEVSEEEKRPSFFSIQSSPEEE